MVEGLLLINKAIQLYNDPKYRKQKIGIGSKDDDKSKKKGKENGGGGGGKDNRYDNMKSLANGSIRQEGIISTRRLSETGGGGEGGDGGGNDEGIVFTTNSNGAGPGPGGVLTNIKSMVTHVVNHKGKEDGETKGDGSHHDVDVLTDVSGVFSPIKEEKEDEKNEYERTIESNNKESKKIENIDENGVDKDNESLNQENQIGATDDYPIYKNESEDEKDLEDKKIQDLNFKNIEKLIDKQSNNTENENGKEEILNLDIENYDIDQDINSDDSILDKIKDEDINLDNFESDEGTETGTSGEREEINEMAKEFEELNIKQKNMELNSNFKKNGDINENKELKKIKNKKKKLKLRKIFKIVKHFHKHHNHNENENENENDNSIKNSKDYYSSVHPSAADYEKSSYFHRKESGSAENASKSADGSATESATESAVDATKNTAKHEAKQDDNDQAEKLQLDNEEIRHDTAEFADSSAGDPAGSDVGHAGHGDRAGEDDSQHDTPAEDDGNAKQADDRAVAGSGKEIPVDYDKFYSESGQKDGPEDGPHYSPDDVPGSGLKDGPENVVSGDSPARDQQAEAWGDAVDDHAPLQRAGSVVGGVKDKLKALV